MACWMPPRATCAPARRRPATDTTGRVREFQLIDRLAARLAACRPDTQLTIGDDAAVVAPAPGQVLAITTDTLISGRHFPDDTPAFDIGWKAIAVNLSDLAAMGAAPAWLTVALSTPVLNESWCDGFVDGALAAIGDAAVDIVGGDTTRGPLSITVTAIGTLPAGAALTRAGAVPGDVVAVTGTLGDAAKGLALWPGRADTGDDPDTAFLLGRLARPQWRDGAAVRDLAHAGIDVSDGFGADLGHVLAASAVGARIELPALPASDALRRRATTDDERRDLQWRGGDDYELCLILPAACIAAARARLNCALTVVGVIEPEPGLRVVDVHGRRCPSFESDAAGWDHFGGRGAV